MHRALNKTLLAASIVLALGSQAAFATNGLAPTGVGQEQKAMGGASAGNPINTMSIATNPAAASFINDGFDVGLEIFKPSRSATQKATGTSFDGNGKSTFVIPEAGYKKQLNDKVALGVVAYGNGGMNTSYGTNPGFGAGSAGVDYQQLFVSPTVSYKISDDAAIGVSANMVYQKFKAEGLQGFDNAFRTSSVGSVTNNGYDSSTGVGATIGVQGNVTDKLSMGASYRSKVKMGKLDKYKGLFPGAGTMDVPAALTVGMAYKATPKTTIAADVQQIYYSDTQYGNSATAFFLGRRLGDPGGPGFGWSDQTVYKLGVKHQLNDNLALMAGINHGKNPVSSSETNFNVLAPGIVEDHISLGFEKKINPKSKLIGSYVHAFNKNVSGDNGPFGAYDLKMKQDAVGIAYSHEF
jgi:long-chain fatty acid transport protein